MLSYKSALVAAKVATGGVPGGEMGYMPVNVDFSLLWKQSLMPAIVATAALFVLLGGPGSAVAQDQDSAGPAMLSEDELFDLVGPVALYPDELLSVVLPASTYPIEIVQAARYLKKYEVDNELKPDEGWDSSVLSLLNYPEVIDMMNEDLDWTYERSTACRTWQRAGRYRSVD